MLDIKTILTYVEKYKTLSEDRVLLGSNDIPSELRPMVATQISLKKNLKHKLPHWAEIGVYIPKAVNLEQASSVETAEYKLQFLSPSDCLLDLTGGLGVDFSAMASHTAKAVYIERDEDLYKASLYNLPKVIGEGRELKFYCLDSMSLVSDVVVQEQATIIYLDPARRDKQENHSKRTFAIEDCSPNLYELISILKKNRKDDLRVLVKLSPMLDIKYCLEHIPQVRSLHIVALHNEVKELLVEIDLSLDKDWDNVSSSSLVAVDLYRHKAKSSYASTWQENEVVEVAYATELGAYVYEPSSAMMKLGIHTSLAREKNLRKLHQHSHLYTSDELISDFQGRVFKLEEVMAFSSSKMKQLKKQKLKANVVCRNFPMKADVLAKKININVGGDKVILATTLCDERQVLLNCYLCTL